MLIAAINAPLAMACLPRRIVIRAPAPVMGPVLTWPGPPADAPAHDRAVPRTREGRSMTTPLGRRDILKGAAAIAAAASFDAASRRPAAAQTARAAIDAVLRQATDAREVPGVVAMAATDKGVLYEGAFGTRDLAKGPAMTTDTFFRIASMTKAVTCVAALQLVEQGKLKIDEPVPNIDPALGSPQ